MAPIAALAPPTVPAIERGLSVACKALPVFCRTFAAFAVFPTLAALAATPAPGINVNTSKPRLVISLLASPQSKPSRFISAVNLAIEPAIPVAAPAIFPTPGIKDNAAPPVSKNPAALAHLSASVFNSLDAPNAFVASPTFLASVSLVPSKILPLDIKPPTCKTGILPPSL